MLSSPYRASSLISKLLRLGFRNYNECDRSSYEDNQKEEVEPMKYGIAWLLGVPVSVLVVWWLIAHVL